VLISPAGVPRAPKDFDPKGNRDKPLLFQLAFSLWERGYSPLSMVRTGAGWGPGRWLVNSYVRRRLGTGATWSHPELYADYMYCNHVAGEGSWGASVHTTLLIALFDSVGGDRDDRRESDSQEQRGHMRCRRCRWRRDSRFRRVHVPTPMVARSVCASRGGTLDSACTRHQRSRFALGTRF